MVFLRFGLKRAGNLTAAGSGCQTPERRMNLLTPGQSVGYTNPLLPLTEPSMKRLLAHSLTAALLLAAPALAGPKEDVSKPLKAVINSVRYGKDVLALKSFAGEEQGKFLLGDDW